MYFTGGEPLINPEHWQLLEDLVASGRAQSISLMYNTNITTIKYKDLDIVDLWSNFKKVLVNCSIDAVGKPLEYIRSGAVWEKINNNIQMLKQNNNITVVLTPVLSILNIWFIADLFEYANQHRLKVTPILLTGPDYLSLDVVPDELKSQALEQVSKIEKYLDINLVKQIQEKIKKNINCCLFAHTITHTLLLDNNRGEKLFDLLPFKSIATNTILKNHEYE
jgi:sulfatase maturation enzyme AslB (radical SAM superfamily)